MPKTAKKRYIYEPEEVDKYSPVWWVEDALKPGSRVAFYGDDGEVLAGEYAEWKNSFVE